MPKQDYYRYKGLFISGINTDIGKTWLSCQLLKHKKNFCNDIWQIKKPVQSGFASKFDKDSDSYLLYQAFKSQNQSLRQQNSTIEDICLFSFKQALAPNSAAKINNIDYTLDDLVQFCQQSLNNNFCLIEGAGGLFSPIADDGLNWNLAHKLNIPCLLISSDYLGSISQTIAVSLAAEKMDIKILAIIINQYDFSSPRNTKTELEKWLNKPIFILENKAGKKQVDLVIQNIVRLIK